MKSTNTTHLSRGRTLLASVFSACLMMSGFLLNAQVTYNYTGGVQTYTVPAGVFSIDVDAYGAAGFGLEGYGGRVQATIPVTPGEVLNIYVGGQGTETTGGYNGGGDAGSNSGYAAGGGASDIRRNGTALTDRILVAGGGGGSGSNCGTFTAEGGHGGGLIGGSGCVFSCSDCQYTGTGGTQSAGGVAGPTSHPNCGGNQNGSLGQGGSNTGGYGTGGGGGYYGGGSGCFEGAGGGSSYTDPSATNVVHTQGARQGNGQIIITAVVSVICDSLTNVMATPGMFCNGSPIDLSAISTGDSIDWYDAITGGNYLGRTASGSTLSVSPTGTTTYYAEVVPPSGGTNSVSFAYTGNLQNWTVPSGVTSIVIDARGGQGGFSFPATSSGGNGGRVVSTMPVTPGQVLEVRVGGAGTAGTANAAGTGGYNGGAVGGLFSGSYSGGGGGGASDIRSAPYGLADRLVVAGGGGGGAYDYSAVNSERGGDGGGLIGQDGYYNSIPGNTTDPYAGFGGTQSAGGLAGNYPGYCIGTNGSLGLGGAGGTCTNSGGGGGAGYYGGGGGVWGGGGGGSSYVGPGGSNIAHTQGFQTGNGEVIITYSGTSCIPPPRQAVTVYADTMPPTADCQAFTVTLDIQGTATITAMDIDGGSGDNCTISSISASQTTFNCSNIGDNNVVLTVGDDNNNFDTCTAVVSVIAPALSSNFSFVVGGAAGLQYDFTDLSTGAVAWAWDFGDGQTSTSQNPSHTYAVDGNYLVCLTVTGPCASDSTCMNVTVVSNSKPFGEGLIELWPNPSNGQFNVRVEGLQGDKLTFELFNLAGQRVMQQDYNQVPATMTQEFRTDLPAGTYFLRVNDGVNNATLRVVLK